MIKFFHSILIILFLLIISIVVKLNYQDSHEKRGFDFDQAFQATKNYVLLRLFVPATTSGIQDDIRHDRTQLLTTLNTHLVSTKPDTKAITQLKQKLINNEKRLKEEDNYLVEKQGKASYYKTVSSPTIKKAKISPDDFTVTPYFLYMGEHSRIMRWVVSSEFTSLVTLTNHTGEKRHFSSQSSSDPYNELLLSDLSAGEWQWHITAAKHLNNETLQNKQSKTISSQGKFTIQKTHSIIFYADTQDSLSQHKKAAKYIATMHKKKNINIIVHGGDITSWGSNESDMVDSAKIISNIGIAGIFIKGNHEFNEAYGFTTDAPYYQKMFSTSILGKTDYQQYELGLEKKVRLLIWDTNFTRMPANSFMAQDAFLRKALNESHKYPLILASHHGYFSKGWHGSFLGSHIENWFEQLYLAPLRAARVPLTLSGHEHVYQRIVDDKSQSQTQHLVAGTVSAKILYPYFNSPGIEKKLARKRTITRLDFESNGIHITTHDFEAKAIIDDFVINY